MNDDEPRQPWDRRPGESSKAHEYFRRFRDLGPLRHRDVLVDPEHQVTKRTLTQWQHRHDWTDRARAWDEQVHRVEDARRLEAIRTMHDRHQRAGRAALTKGIEALARVAPEEIPPYAAARLVELGARLERDTLVVSVEELQGIPAPREVDPWDEVARELDSLPGA